MKLFDIIVNSRFESVFGIVVVLWLWFEKNYFIKNTFSWGWVDIYICLVKTVVAIEVEQKVV
jgi:hypothetical protein